MTASLDLIAKEISRLAGGEMPIAATALLQIDGLGDLVIDGTGDANVVSTGAPAGPPDVTIAMDAATLAGLLDGSQDAGAAFTQGRIVVTGKVEVAMALAAFWDRGDPY
ncbi:MAG: SCP2 sterol-binding domain-containing protein [Azospirillaceae bacterium]